MRMIVRRPIPGGPCTLVYPGFPDLYYNNAIKYPWAEDVYLMFIVNQTVYWNGKTDVTAMAGKPVRFYFKIRRAKLYGFQFTAD